MNIHFKLHQATPCPSSNASIFAYINIFELNISLPTGIHIWHEDWDEDNKRMKGKSKVTTQINDKLHDFKKHAEQRYGIDLELTKEKFLKPYEIHMIVYEEMMKIIPRSKPRQTLTHLELARLARYSPENIQLKRLSSQYLLSCYTSLSLLEISELTSCDIRQWFDRLYIKRYLDTKEVTVPLLEIALNWINHLDEDRVGSRCPKLYKRVLLDIPKALNYIGSYNGITKPLTIQCSYNTYISTVLSTVTNR